jgi:two-component system phosphate regulon sensor histidine kinase PhoR
MTNEWMAFIIIILSLLGWIGFRKIRTKKHRRFLKSLSQFMNELEAVGAGERFIAKEIPKDYEVLIRSVNNMSESFRDKWEYMKMLQDRFKVILDNMSNVVILVDGKGYISYINPSGEATFGQSRVHLIGKSHWRIGRESGLSEAIDHMLDGQAVNKQEIILPFVSRNASKNLMMEMTIVADRDEENIHGAIIILHDITERKEMERLRKEFVANVSHELRTPLTAIQGYSETLMSGAINDPKAAMDFLKVIYDESIRLHKMVNDMLDLSKLEHQKKSVSYDRVDLQEVIASVLKTVKLQAAEKNISLIVGEMDEPLYVKGDFDLLRQLILNLVTNAIKYTNHDGRIKIQSHLESEHVKVTIEDSGIGISEEHLPRIFERFYRVEASRNMASGGRGLGLSIVKHILQLHGGQINVESETGKGTLFTILFPYSGV